MFSLSVFWMTYSWIKCVIMFVFVFFYNTRLDTYKVPRVIGCWLSQKTWNVLIFLSTFYTDKACCVSESCACAFVVCMWSVCLFVVYVIYMCMYLVCLCVICVCLVCVCSRGQKPAFVPRDELPFVLASRQAAKEHTVHTHITDTHSWISTQATHNMHNNRSGGCVCVF